MFKKSFFILSTLLLLQSCEKNKETNTVGLDLFEAEFRRFESLCINNDLLRQTYIQRLLVYEYLFNNDEFKVFNQEFRNIDRIFVTYIHDTQHEIWFLKDEAKSQESLISLIDDYEQSFFADWIKKVKKIEEMMNMTGLMLFFCNDEKVLFDYNYNFKNNIDLFLRLIMTTNKILELEQVFLILNSNTVPNCDREIKQFNLVKNILESPMYNCD